MFKTEKIRICDQCGKEVSDRGELWVGPGPWTGWFKLEYTIMNNNTQLDFCSHTCLQKFLQKNFS